MRPARSVLLFLLLFFKVVFIGAQTTYKLFFDYNKNFVDSSKADFYSIYKTSSDSVIKSGTIETYFMNSTLLKRVDYKFDERDIERKKVSYFYDNGNIESISNLIGLDLHGEQLAYFSDGKLKRKAVYDNNIRIEGSCFTHEGKDTAYYETADRMPFYPGGKAAMDEFFRKNMIYPQDAIDAGVSGTVQLGLTIGKLGNLQSIRIEKRVFPSIDAEASRLVKKMAPWSPGFYKDDLLSKYERIFINFELPKK